MQYAAFSGTGLRVSRLCLGSMTFGSPVSETDAIHLVRYAFEQHGINFVDTANMYEGYARYAGSAGGVAEEIIGKAIQGHRSDYVLATKVGMKVGGAPEDEYTSPEAIRVQLRRSLKRLGTDYIDLYYLHRYDPYTPPELIARAIGNELKAGTIRYWGVSNYTAEQMKNLVDAAKKEHIPLPCACQPALSLLNRVALDDILPYCKANNIGVIPYQVLQGGLLTGKYQRGQSAPEGSRMAEKPEWMRAMKEEDYAVLENSRTAAEHQHMTMTQYALRWALEQPAVVSALIGVKRAEQIDEAVLAL